MERQAARLERSATRTAAPAGGSDPVAERANQIGAQHAYSASAAVVRTGDQMIGSLLDIVA